MRWFAADGGLRPKSESDVGGRWWRKAQSDAELHGATTPQQVCPRACGFRETATRVLVTRTALWGRARLRVLFEFDASHCPTCGARLARTCRRCHQPILSGPNDRCRFCGVPHLWARERTHGRTRTLGRDWQKASHEVFALDDDLRLSLFDGDITTIEVTAVVSNDDTDGQMWTDVARAIKAAAGEDVQRVSVEGGPYPLGTAWVTDAGLLRAESVIHVAATTPAGYTDLGVVADAVRAALREAIARGFRTVALPAIGSGTSGHDIVTCVRVIAGAVAETLVNAHGHKNLHVVLTVFERADIDALVAAAKEAAAGEFAKYEAEHAEGSATSSAGGP